MATINWYIASNLTALDANSLQQVPDPGDYTDIPDGSKCFVMYDDQILIYEYDSSSSDTEVVPLVVTPDGNTGNGRWIKKDVAPMDQNGFVYPDLNGQSGTFNTQTTLSWNDPTRELTITPVSSSFSFRIEGAPFLKDGADTVAITDVEGVHWIYYDNDGALKVQAPGGTTDDLILKKCLVAQIYWDATNSTAILVGDERHGSNMAPATHYHIHETIGALWEEGLEPGDILTEQSGASDTHIQCSLSDGEYHDEDIEIVISNGSPQTLRSILNAPIVYLDGASGNIREIATSNFPVSIDGGDTLPSWNELTGGAWQRTEISNNKYMCVHLAATNDTRSPMIWVMGQAEYNSISDAQEGAEVELDTLSTGTITIEEVIFIATMIVQSSSSYGNTVKSRFRQTGDGGDFIDWRGGRFGGGSGTSSNNHNSLGGLQGGTIDEYYHLTSAQETDLTDGGETTLHYHNALKDSAETGALYNNGGSLELNYNGFKTGFTNVCGLTSRDPSAAAPCLKFQNSSDTEIGALTAGSVMYLDNTINSGTFELRGKSSGGVTREMITADPDGKVVVHHKGNVAYDTFSDDANYHAFKLYSHDAVKASWFVQYDTGAFEITNGNEGSAINMYGIPTGGGANILATLDPNGSVQLYNSGVKTFATLASGTSGGLKVFDDSESTQGQLYLNSATGFLTLYNTTHGGPVVLAGENASGTYKNLYYADPDGASYMYWAGDDHVETNSTGAIINRDGTDTAVLAVSGSSATASGGILQLYGGSTNNTVAIDNYSANIRFYNANSSELYCQMLNNAGVVLYDNAVAICRTAAATFRPEVDNTPTLGTGSYRWNEIFCTNATINTSDRRDKTRIAESNLGLDFIMDLKPVSYMWKDYDIQVPVRNPDDINDETKTEIREFRHHRTHYGLIAQDVRTTLDEYGIEAKHFAGYVRDENGRFGLRYSEFISPMIKSIQELDAKVVRNSRQAIDRMEQLECALEESFVRVKQLENEKAIQAQLLVDLTERVAALEAA